MNFSNKHIILAFYISCLSPMVCAQGTFKLINVDKVKTSFNLISNLIIFPIEVNGKELNFILDSGVGTTILFNIQNNDSIQLNKTQKIKLQGLGKDAAVEAILSKENTFKLNSIEGKNQNLYVIFDDSFDLSSKVGMTIHGIIGYNLLKDFVITVNYSTKKLAFYDPTSYVSNKCNKCEVLPIEFNKNKPFVNAAIRMKADPNKLVDVKLLVDSGGSDAMWLFENSKPEIIVPNNYFVDFLGEGLSGSVYGKRSVIEGLVIGKFEFKKPTVSFPDSLSVAHARKFEERNGSMGASILKRFVVTFNYPNNEIILKKGGNFNNAFRYNMSGITIAHNGKVLVKEHDFMTFALANKNTYSSNDQLVVDYNYKYTFKPSYRIQKITYNSPAYHAGLLKDDIIIKINGKYTYGMKLEEIVTYFYLKENTKITMVIERNGQNYVFDFRLKNVLNDN